MIPVDLYQVPLTLVSLKKKSKVVAERLNADQLDGTVVKVLKELGVVVMTECPKQFHPELTGTFVHPPSVSGVLQAMIVSSLTLGQGMFSAIMLDRIDDASKRSFRKFISKISSLRKEEKDLVSDLPLFETLSGNFVAKKDHLCAAPEEMPPILPEESSLTSKMKNPRN